MRYSRLTQAIKNVTVGGMAEKSSPAGASKTAKTPQKKRKRVAEDSDEDSMVPARKSRVKTPTSPDDDTINAKAEDDAGETSDTKEISANSIVQDNKSSRTMDPTTPPRMETKEE